MLIIDIRDFRANKSPQVEVDEDDIASGLTALGEGWKTPLALRVRIKPMTNAKVFTKAARVSESDDEWRINIYVPLIKTDALVPHYAGEVNRYIGQALAKVVKGRGYNVEDDSITLEFVSVKRAQGSK